MGCTALSSFGMHNEDLSNAPALIIEDSPKRNEPSPLSLIPGDLKALQRAEDHPKIALISDWEHLTSEEYAAAEQASGLDL